jgi:hypothetical protein
MNIKADSHRRRFKPQLCRSLENAVAQRIAEQFPRIGGPRIQQLCAQMALEVVFDHLRPAEFMKHGQILWAAISRDHPPTPRKPLSTVPLVPVVLTISTPHDVEQRISREKWRERLSRQCVRLCNEAYEQGAVLSNSDLALMLGKCDSQIAAALTSYERQTQQLVPRRGTLHDAGSALTHKRIICIKRWAEGKSSDLVARETYHTIEAVDRYLGMFERVRCCRNNGMNANETAFTLGCSERLVKEYLDIDNQLRSHSNANT